MAHRLAYFLTYGPFPKDQYVCHKCDTPACCNPDHLFLGSPLDNVKDMVAKNRVGNRKLLPTEAKELKRLSKTVPLTMLAEKFNISYSTAQKISKGLRWPHLK